MAHPNLFISNEKKQACTGALPDFSFLTQCGEVK